MNSNEWRIVPVDSIVMSPKRSMMAALTIEQWTKRNNYKNEAKIDSDKIKMLIAENNILYERIADTNREWELFRKSNKLKNNHMKIFRNNIEEYANLNISFRRHLHATRKAIKRHKKAIRTNKQIIKSIKQSKIQKRRFYKKENVDFDNLIRDSITPRL